MIFVPTDELKVGMRLAKPIYNKNGVLLYERNTKLTLQGIYSVKNFGLIGLYILEPAEPLPPMTAEDIEFERFQTMAVFSIKDDLKAIQTGKKPGELMVLANQIVRMYGGLKHKITFTQNLRSPEDYVYKHSLNVSILAALISNQLHVGSSEQMNIVVAALLYDVGRLFLPTNMQNKTDDFDAEEYQMFRKAQADGYNMVEQNPDINTSVKRLVRGCHQDYDLEQENSRNVPIGVRVIQVAHYYDVMTAMNLYGVPESEVQVVRNLLQNNKVYDPVVVTALLDSIRILSPGVCVELTNGERGLVIRENDKDPLLPMVLSFDKNQVYDLSSERTAQVLQVKDLMKTMDNRIVVDDSTLQEYMHQ
jgi:HD-GYP domain-containing protein (c-di-GMP phosphodiesterase class II)